MHKYLHCQNFNDQAIESKREEIFSLSQSYRHLSATVQPFGASLSEKFSDLFACFAGAKWSCKTKSGDPSHNYQLN